MPKVSLSTKYRPQDFNDVCSQESIVKILEQQLKTDNIKNCYLFCGPSGCGKAQPLTSKILTPTGYKLMKDIQIGDKIIDGQGNITKVLGVFPQGERDIYKITFNDKTSIEVADNHLNSVYYTKYHKHKEKERVYETLDTLTLMSKVNSGEKYKVNIPTLDCWKEKKLPINPYLLGCLIGDGCLTNDNFRFSNSENDILEKVDSILRQEWGMYLKKTPSKSVDYRINYIKRTTPNKLRVALDNLGLTVKSVDKHIPKEYLYNSFENRLALIQGLFDTDGFIHSQYKNNYFSCNYEWTTSSSQLAEDMEFLLRSIGCQVTITKRIGKYTKKENKEKVFCNTSYRFHIHPRNNIKIFSSIKHSEKYKTKENEPMRVIKSIELVRKDLCQCIYVESPEHTYITDNMTVTHNTTIARILANKINKGQGQPIEIDAASNSGVDNVRNLIESSNTKSISSEYKIYVVDECHSLSNNAWQAFLKTLEEPNSKTIFMFCTTEVQKVPTTILNRVQRFDLSKIPFDKIYNRLIMICNKENFTYEEEALKQIVKLSKGRLRDAITSLDKVSSLDTNITMKNVIEVLNTIDYKTMFHLTDCIVDKNDVEIFNIINSIDAKGIDFKVFISDYANFILDINKYLILNTFDGIEIPNYFVEDMKYTISFENADKFFVFLLMQLVKLKEQIRYETDTKSAFEMSLLSITKK